MFPTLKPGHEVLVFNWAYLFSQPKVGDIVVIRHNGREMIKRIQKYHDRDIFVYGDNEDGSTDSRDFGPIPQARIAGKVVFIG